MAIAPAAYDSKVEGNIIISRLDACINWMRKNSLWPMPMGLACCGIELMVAGASRFDIARFAAEVMRFSPPRGCLRQRLPTPSESFVRGIDETATQDHA